jgi:hypothetical protein
MIIRLQGDIFTHYTLADRVIGNLMLKVKRKGRENLSPRRGVSQRRFVNFNFAREADIFGVKASGYYIPIRDTLSKENRISHEAEHNSACLYVCVRTA